MQNTESKRFKRQMTRREKKHKMKGWCGKEGRSIHGVSDDEKWERREARKRSREEEKKETWIITHKLSFHPNVKLILGELLKQQKEKNKTQIRSVSFTRVSKKHIYKKNGKSKKCIFSSAYCNIPRCETTTTQRYSNRWMHRASCSIELEKVVVKCSYCESDWSIFYQVCE